MITNETHSSTMSDSEVVGTLRRVMPDLYFINTPGARMRRHLECLSRLPDEKLILDFYWQPGTPLTELTLCTYDDVEPGLLAKVCGTLAALRIDVHTAFIYTLSDQGLKAPTEGANARNNGAQTQDAQDAQDGAPRRIVLDTLLLTERYYGHNRPLTPAKVRRVRSELTGVLRGETTVAQLLARMQPLARARLLARPYLRPVPSANGYDVTVTNNQAQVSGTGDCADEALTGPRPCRTVIRVQAEDKPDVLYRATAALAAFGLNICIAQFNTIDGSTNATFFVTDAEEQPLSVEQLATVEARLRVLLQDSAAPLAAANGS